MKLSTLYGKIAAALVAAGMALGAPASLAQVDIVDVPLFVTATVDPNVIAAIDDSGSMDAEILAPTNDGAMWWRTGTHQEFVGLDRNDNVSTAGVLNYNNAGGAGNAWKKYIYLIPNGTGTGNRVYSDSTHDHYAVPPFIQYGFIRSAEYNGTYYDHRIDYTPWLDGGGFTFSNANSTAAKSDPTLGTGTIDLTVDRRDTGGNRVFRLHNGMVVPKGATYRPNTSWVTVGADTTFTNAGGNIGVEYYPATYFTVVKSSATYSVTGPAATTLTGSCDAPNPAHYREFALRPGTFTNADGTVDALAYDGHCLKRHEIRNDGRPFPSGRSYADEIQNFANWYTYYRNRHLATRGGISAAFDGLNTLRVGALTINSRSLRGMYALSDPAQQETFLKYIYERGGNRGGTPNREAMKFVGDTFNTNTSVITESCQQNFGLLFTDGFSNPANPGVGNADGGMGAPFADSHSNTMADIAAYFYNNPLRAGDFSDETVPVPSACDRPNPPAWLDCNKRLHMVTYGITLGAQGNIFGVTHHNVQDAHANPPAWENPTQVRNPVQVDDLYHAAVNGRGRMLNARTADELRQALRTALLEIVARVTTSSTSAATSSAVLQTDTLLYSALFRSIDWSGNVRAFEIDDEDGTIEGALWSAEEELADRIAPRNLLTYDGSSGRLLEFAQLSSAQEAALNHNAQGVADGRAEDRVAWLRGQSPAGLRSRTSGEGLRLIGDIVGGTPVYLGKPNLGYYLLPPTFQPDDYNTYRLGMVNRNELLIVAANGGMLHGFNAQTGDELFGYVPSEVLLPVGGGDFAPASILTDVDYQHIFTVDGTPSVSDALLSDGTDAAWKTVLVGSMGIGGRTVFALDVTDPENMTTAKVLWEFTDPDLGYGVSDVQIVPMANGTFAAVFGNGYNSNSDRAILFVVNISDGSLIAKLDTGEGSALSANGLGPVQTSDWPQSDLVTQVVYAGDIQGNLWRFNLQSTDPADWHGGIHQLFSATDSLGNQQPITVQPRVSVNPDAPGELLISFGTGSYFRDQDRLTGTPQIQTLYGIRDTGSTGTTWTRSDLLQQEITWESVEMALGQQRLVRAISNNEYTAAPNVEKGWYLDLVYDSNAKGERVISRATFPSGSPRQRVRFTTMTPNDEPCTVARQGFIFDVDLATGGPADLAVFDINNDGVFTAADLIDGKVISGIGGGIGEELTVIRNRDGSGDYFYDGGGERVGEGSNPEGRASDDPVGRQSWQQLR